jgi:hypothetical protein
VANDIERHRSFWWNGGTDRNSEALLAWEKVV